MALAKAIQFDQTLAELELHPAPDTPEFAGDVQDSDVARKPAGQNGNTISCARVLLPALGIITDITRTSDASAGFAVGA